MSGSLVGAGGNLIISSPIGGNINAGVGNLTISQSVAGDIEAAVGTLTLTPQASVSGQVNYWSEDELFLAQGASVSGTITRNDPNQTFAKNTGPEKEEAFLTTGRIIFFFSLLIIGLLLVKFAPNYTKATAEKLTTKPLPSVGVGFLALIITPLAAAFIMFTVIGIPLGLILLATYFIYLYISRIFVVYWIGDYATKKFKYKLSMFWSYIIGVLIFSLIALLPVVGGVLKFIAMLLGLGSMILTWKEVYKKLQKNKIV